MRLRAKPTLKDYCIALAITATLLPALAWGAVTVFPTGCDVRGDPSLFRWTCLFPGLMMSAPIGVALVLPIIMVVNRRSAKPLPDGILPVALTTGIVTQVVLIGGYYVALGPAYRREFLGEIVSIPQPFVAGALSATLFWAALALRQPK